MLYSLKKRKTTTHKNHDFLNCFALGLIVWEIGIGSGTVPHGFKRPMAIVKVTPTKYQTLYQWKRILVAELGNLEC